MSRVPVCTLSNPHGNEGMTAARISPNAKYIVTVGNGKCQNVHFWLWTYDKDKPKGSSSNLFISVIAFFYLKNRNILFVLFTTYPVSLSLIKNVKFSASVLLTDMMSERVKEVIFNDDYPEQFALTTDYHVLFLTWVGKILQSIAFIKFSLS